MQNEGATLAEPRNYQIQAEIVALPVGFYWLGIWKKDNQWVYISNNRPIQWTNWHQGEPNNHKHEHCVQINGDFLHGIRWTQWANQKCDHPLAFPCQKPLLPMSNDPCAGCRVTHHHHKPYPKGKTLIRNPNNYFYYSYSYA